ncbi:hypothetical protein [Flagellimonas marina]|uniref:Uncharacterized protein n=1 Tax=Flagellimonas marina TaxID=1775168 RepID=A0ABV8PNL1_9FLAO
MKIFYLGITASFFFITGWAQEVSKDTLHFKFDPNYMVITKNYEGVYAFMFKEEKLVTSAFGNIKEEELFFFTQSGFPPKKYNLKPNKIYCFQKFLRKRRGFFRDTSTGKLDAYKMMKYFDKHIVFFAVGNDFIKVDVHTSLAE